MTATYNATANCLEELLPPDLDPAIHDANAHPDLYEEYKAVSATLRTIPCSPECRGLWAEGQVLEEGKDYEVRVKREYFRDKGRWLTPVEDMGNPFDDGEFMAFPLPVKCEDDFLKSIDEMDEGSKLFVDKSMAIANRICELLESKGIKQKDLAELMGKTEAEISRMLSGMHNLTMRTISKIEAVLESDIICIPEAK